MIRIRIGIVLRMSEMITLAIATMVTLVSEVLKAFAYDVSVQLSVYIGLIITNCILMGRLEAFAMQNKPWPSFLDGIGNGVGYAMILVIVAFFREFFGTGALLNIQIIPESFYEAGYMNNGLMLMTPAAFILIACIVWFQRAKDKSLQEK